MLNSGFLLLSRLGFGIPISSRILDSLSCIPDSTKKIPGFQISLGNISQILESGYPYICIRRFQKLIRLNRETAKG